MVMTSITPTIVLEMMLNMIALALWSTVTFAIPPMKVVKMTQVATNIHFMGIQRERNLTPNDMNWPNITPPMIVHWDRFSCLSKHKSEKIITRAYRQPARGFGAFSPDSSDLLWVCQVHCVEDHSSNPRDHRERNKVAIFEKAHCHKWLSDRDEMLCGEKISHGRMRQKTLRSNIPQNPKATMPRAPSTIGAMTAADFHSIARPVNKGHENQGLDIPYFCPAQDMPKTNDTKLPEKITAPP